MGGQPVAKGIDFLTSPAEFMEAVAASTPTHHLPEVPLNAIAYDLAAYIKEAVEAMKDRRPPPDPTDYAMEELAPLSL